ncbi:MAG TPA: outer membrane protein transport protein, partial [Candidatus Nanopelagicales bacterium]|nr:outer membrane protein transport protein [Candidatus Nanopelagicales bacterium]
MPTLRSRPASARYAARAASLALVLVGAFQAEPALASGFSSARFGAEHGNPVTPNPTAVYYNPASLGETEGFHLFVDGSLALRSAGWQHALAETDDDSSAATYTGGRWGEGQPNAGQATLFNVIAAPMIGASYKLGDLAFGAGWYVPFGGQATWDKDENYNYEGADFAAKPAGLAPAYPGPYDGVQRFHTISGAIQSMYFTLAAAYKIPGVGLSIGVSGNFIRSSVKTLRARTVAGDNTLASEGRSLIDVSGLHASFGVGLMYEAIPKKLWFGASYQAQPGFGEMELTGTLRNEVTGLPAETAVSMYQSLPDIIRLGARWKPTDDLELRLFGDFSRWSVMQNQCIANEGQPCEVDETGAAAGGSNPIVNISREWNDAFGIRAGLSYWPTEVAEV